ncbi:MAG TPA: DUF1572 family protein [Gemmatimonadales bacterium]|nr:DUF1572 family protein [Gemmatimonadales bacterium]
MNHIIASLRAEYLRYKGLAEAAIGQLSEAELTAAGTGDGNSVAVICWHVAGNLRSRFTDFLTTDGEKPWRKRDEEFRHRIVTHAELLEHWERGWAALLGTLNVLTDADLEREVTIRGQPLRVSEALHRSLAHASYHVGQVVYAARGLRGSTWRFLSIPPGQSEQYNARPILEKPAAHLGSLRPQR